MSRAEHSGHEIRGSSPRGRRRAAHPPGRRRDLRRAPDGPSPATPPRTISRTKPDRPPPSPRTSSG
ncbi:hypothetical protein QJS66_15950 [Kocuria rhizophila]|nr:hypothetical protein QJS66_15950 [Kocuria rhizophila]